MPRFQGDEGLVGDLGGGPLGSFFALLAALQRRAITTPNTSTMPVPTPIIVIFKVCFYGLGSGVGIGSGTTSSETITTSYWESELFAIIMVLFALSKTVYMRLKKTSPITKVDAWFIWSRCVTAHSQYAPFWI